MNTDDRALRYRWVRSNNRLFGVVATMQRTRDRLADSRFDRAVDVFGSLLDAGRIN